MRSKWLILAPILAVVVLGDCSEPSEIVRFPSTIRVTSGDDQSEYVGRELAEPLVATLLDSDGGPVEGWIVISRAVGGGSVAAPSGATNADGTISNRWTLGTDPAVDQLLSVEALNLDGSVLVSVTFRANAVPGPADTLVGIAGDGQAAPVATALTTLPAVAVLDPFDNVVPGVAVTFSVANGGGTVTDSVQTTGSEGTASIGSWTMGTVVGENRLTALIVTPAPAPGETQSASRDLTVGFTATALPGAPASVTVVGGDGQSATVGTQLAESLSVRVADAFGNAVPGEFVLFAVSAGGGSLTPLTATTDAMGIAWTRWTVGTDVTESQTVTVSLPGAPGVGGAGFAATAVAGTPAVLEIVGGDGQSGVAGEQLPQPLVVKATDEFGNSVSGTDVQYAVLTGGGAVADATVVTDADGLAETLWTAGAGAAGQQTASAALPGATGTQSSVVFTATTLVGTAATLTVAGGDGQSAEVGAVVAESLVVRVSDAHDNAVPGEPVLFTVAGGGSLSATTDTTGADGLAWTRWTLGTDVAVAQAVDVSLPNAPGVAGVSFAATSLVGPPTTLEVVGGNGQSAIAGTQLPQPLVVKATDDFDNPVPGTDVMFTVASGGGSVGAATVATDGDGLAQSTWTTGPIVGQQTVRAELPGATGAGSSVLFEAAVATALPPAVLASVDGDNQTGPVESTLPVPLQVLVTDVDGNPVAGAEVVFAASAGVINPAIDTTDTEGYAGTLLTLPPTAGAVTVTATSGALQAGFDAFAVADPVGNITITLESPQPLFIVGDTLTLVVRTESQFEVTGVTATAGDSTIDLVFEGGRWRGELIMTGQPFDVYWLELTATGIFGETRQVARQFAFDLPPTMEVLHPYPWARADRDIRVWATCEDFEAPCDWRVRIGGSNIAFAHGYTLDTTLPLDGPEGTRNLHVYATDSRGQEVEVATPFFIETSPYLQLVDTVPGVIQAVDATRIVYQHAYSSVRELRLRNRITGQDELIRRDIHGNDMGGVVLTPYGLAFNNQYRVFEYENGVVTDIGPGASPRVVEPFVLWRTGSGLWLMDRRTRTVVRDIGYPQVPHGALGENGVVYYSGVYRYENGTDTFVAPGSNPLYDGHNLVYFSTTANDWVVATPGGEEPLGGAIDPVLRNGWVAFRREGAGIEQIWTRSPTGEIRQATFFGTRARFLHLGENGEVAFWADGTNYRIAEPPYTPTPFNTEAGLGKGMFQVDGIWYMPTTWDGSLFEIVR